MNEANIKPGIRGWLIVFAILLLGAPGNFISHAISVAREFDSPIVSQFTDPTSPTYDPRWAGLIFSDTAAFSLAAALGFFVLWPLFFFHHRHFRTVFVVYALGLSTLLVSRVFLSATIPTVAAEHRASIYMQTTIWLPVVLGLAVYVIRSRRSQLTFRRRLAWYPVFPFFTRI